MRLIDSDSKVYLKNSKYKTLHMILQESCSKYKIHHAIVCEKLDLKNYVFQTFRIILSALLKFIVTKILLKMSKILFSLFWMDDQL